MAANNAYRISPETIARIKRRLSTGETLMQIYVTEGVSPDVVREIDRTGTYVHVSKNHGKDKRRFKVGKREPDTYKARNLKEAFDNMMGDSIF